MTINMIGSVGIGGQNQYDDTLAIQMALNKVSPDQGGPKVKLAEDGKCGPKTEKAIQEFQLHNFGWSIADGRVDPGGPTHNLLEALTTETIPEFPGSGGEVPEFPEVGGESPGIDGVEIISSSSSWKVDSAPAPPALNPWDILFNHRLRDHPSDFNYFVNKMKATPQELEPAFGAANVDCYAVQITKMPQGSDGHTMSADEFTYYVRMNINTFANATLPTLGRLGTFNPYDAAIDGPIWKSKTKYGHLARISIEIPPDSGSVGVVAGGAHNWIFKTFHTDKDGDHPVSGNRMFGFILPDVGREEEVWFGTRGVDRVTDASVAYGTGALWGISGLIIGANYAVPIPFLAGRLLWRSFRENLYTWINSHGGAAKKTSLYEKAYDWADIKRHYVKVVV